MRIQLPYDSCPVAEFELGGKLYAIKLNLAAIHRANARLKGREDVPIDEADGVQVYEAAIENGMELDFDEHMRAWMQQTQAQFLALRMGINALYNPPKDQWQGGTENPQTAPSVH